MSNDFVPVMNNTKWNEIRVHMYELDPPPKWRTKDLENGHVSQWDREWFYHFRNGGYQSIEWLEIHFDSQDHRERILSELASIHVPGYEKNGSIFVVGHLRSGASVDYIAA